MKRLSSIPSTVSFADRYAEYQQLGYQDWEIAKKMGYTLESLARQLNRHRLPVPGRLQQMIRGNLGNRT